MGHRLQKHQIHDDSDNHECNSKVNAVSCLDRIVLPQYKECNQSSDHPQKYRQQEPHVASLSCWLHAFFIIFSKLCVCCTFFAFHIIFLHTDHVSGVIRQESGSCCLCCFVIFDLCYNENSFEASLSFL